MADYFTQLVFRQNLKRAEISPLEWLVLRHTFDFEDRDDGEVYFFSGENGECSFLTLDVQEFREAYDAEAADEARREAFVEKLKECEAYGDFDLDQILSSTENTFELEFDLRIWPWIVQQVVKRSTDLRYVAVFGSFTCSRVVRDGFGGEITFITADRIECCSTESLLKQFVSDMARNSLMIAEKLEAQET